MHNPYLQCRLDTNDAFALIDMQLQTRHAMIKGNYLDAALLFAGYLENDIRPKSTLQSFYKIHSGAQRARDEWQEEIARDYRDFGRCLYKLEFKDNISHAIAAWEKGLSLSSGWGNLRFQNDILRRLKRLT